MACCQIPRHRYAEQARHIANIKRVMLDRLSDERALFSFTARLKTESKHLAAFRDELNKVLPDALAGSGG